MRAGAPKTVPNRGIPACVDQAVTVVFISRELHTTSRRLKALSVNRGAPAFPDQAAAVLLRSIYPKGTSHNFKTPKGALRQPRDASAHRPGRYYYVVIIPRELSATSRRSKRFPSTAASSPRPPCILTPGGCRIFVKPMENQYSHPIPPQDHPRLLQESQRPPKTG